MHAHTYGDGPIMVVKCSLSHTKPSSNDVHVSNFDFQFPFSLFFSLFKCDPQVETCQEQIFSLELEESKSLESPLTPNAITNIEMALEQLGPSRNACDDSDDNHSMVTVVPGNANNNNIDDDILYLDQTSSDSSDYMNANSTASTMTRTLQTIVEVVNPILVNCGDGSATEIAVGRMTNDDLSLPSFDVDEEEEEESSELSLNDKMKNVLKELKENEKVRLNWSRSMEDDEANVDDVEMPEAGDVAYEEKTGSIGTVFTVRERLINDFYDHEHVVNQENIDNCQVFSNPSVDEFLAHEIRHAQATAQPASAAVERESLTLDLRKTINDEDEDDDDETTTTENTPTTPTKSLEANVTVAGSKKRRRNKKSKAKK